MHNWFLCSFCCLTFLASTLEVTEKKQKTNKKQNTAHPSEPNRNTMQKPIGGRSVLAFSAAISALAFGSLYKGGGGRGFATIFFVPTLCSYASLFLVITT